MFLDFILSYCCGAQDDSTYECSQQMARSKYLNQNCRKYVDDSLHIKSIFAETEIAKLQAVSGHTHGDSAARRSEASILMDMVGKQTGRRVVQYQGSSADVRNNRVITRTWHWLKDMQVEPTSVVAQDNDMLCMVDVDYYVDMPQLLSERAQPVMLYTIQPGSVARNKGEYKYTFNENNEIDYKVAGGGHYRHKLWNYDGDSISATSWFCCFPKRFVAYNIERKRVDDDHSVILMTPLASFSWFYAWHARKTLGFTELKRLQVSDGEFLRLVTNNTNGMLVHTGLVNSYICSSVPIEADDAIRCACQTSTNKLTLAGLRTRVEDYQGSIVGIEVLHLYHRKRSEGAHKPEMVSNLTEAVRCYQWSEKVVDLDHETKPSMVAFMNPILHGAFVPDDCLNNDKRLIDERVKKVISKAEITDNVHRRAVEFVDHLVKLGVKDLRMCDHETVYEKQSKPSQRSILHNADYESSVPFTKSFMKKEAYQTITDPRNISQINGPDKRDYSRVCYPLTDAIKKFKWYAFGKTPKHVALRVAEICYKAAWVLITDFSRMDGRISPAVRYFERLLLSNVFHPDEVNVVLKLWKTQHGLRGRTKFGVTYNTESSRLSGSPETSIFNTLLTAFIMFMAYRGTKVNGANYTVEEAFELIGIAGGDDGLTRELSQQALTRCAKQMGQVLTSDRIERGGFGVTFLSRYYSRDIWNAIDLDDISSVCDIRRVLQKFHVTVRLTKDITAEQKLFDKAFALHLTDSNTPVIGLFVTKVLQLFGNLSFTNCVGIWNVEKNISQQYPNNNADWAWELMERDLPQFDIVAFTNWIVNANKKTIFLAPPFHPPIEISMKEGIVMCDGDIHVKKSTGQQLAPVEDKKTSVRKPKPEKVKDVKPEDRKSRKVRFREPRTASKEKKSGSK